MERISIQLIALSIENLGLKCPACAKTLPLVYPYPVQGSRLARRTKAIQALISRHTRGDHPLFLKDFEMPMGLGETEKDIPPLEIRKHRPADREEGHFIPGGKYIQDLLPTHPVVTDYLIDPLPWIGKGGPMAGQDLFYSQCAYHFQRKINHFKPPEILRLLGSGNGSGHPVQFENGIELRIFADPELLIYYGIRNSAPVCKPVQ